MYSYLVVGSVLVAAILALCLHGLESLPKFAVSHSTTRRHNWCVQHYQPVCQLLLEGVLANKSHKDFTPELQTLKWGSLYFSFTALVARNHSLHSPVCCLQAHQTKIWCHHLPAGYCSHSEKCGVSTEHVHPEGKLYESWVAAVVMTLVVVKY